MITEELYKSIERGRKGLNKGLSTGLEKLDRVIYGVQRGWLYSIFGDTGSSKSTFTNFIAIYQPYKQWLLANKSFSLQFLLFSFEMSAEVVFAKLLSLHIYEEYHYVISYEKILSLRNTPTDIEYEYILQSMDWLKDLESICKIIDKSVSADGVYAITKDWTKQFGNYESDGIRENYIPNDPEQYLIVIMDHVSLISSKGPIKPEIDKVVNYIIGLRNKCKLTVYLVQQANRNLKETSRRDIGTYLQLNDLRDTSDTSNAAEVVIGLYFPFREKVAKCEGYDIKQLTDRLRLMQILKNRFGISDVNIGLNFFGEIGYFKNLPKPEQINDYSIYTKL